MESDPAPSRSSRFAWVQTWPGILTLGFFALVIVVALGYAEENWRGERVWAATKAELEARGESFDRAKFIPPPVPDEQNFGALPYFQTGSDGRMRIMPLIQPVNSKMPYWRDEGKDSLPYLGDWRKGEKTNYAGAEERLSDFLHHQDRTAQIPPGATPLDIFSKICPVLADLREANRRTPQCRFEVNYLPSDPLNADSGPVTEPMEVVRVLSYDSNLALLSHRPEVALQDLQVCSKIYAGFSHEPYLFSGSYALSVVADQLSVIELGLFEHEWNDAQLTQFDNDLGELDVLADAQLTLRGDFVLTLLPVVDTFIANRSLLLEKIHTRGGSFDYTSYEEWQELGIRIFYTYVPNGWLRINEADTVRRILDGARSIVPKAPRVDPRLLEKLTPTDGTLGFMSEVVAPRLEGVKPYAHSQAQIDMARIACRLERYRLAHGSYPARLGALVPTYGASLPRDIMSGQPYIYDLEMDGTYLLYSVAWNLKDDHGDISSPSSPHDTHSSDESLDWVWQNHPIKKK